MNQIDEEEKLEKGTRRRRKERFKVRGWFLRRKKGMLEKYPMKK